MEWILLQYCFAYVTNANIHSHFHLNYTEMMKIDQIICANPDVYVYKHNTLVC